jgi:hypothetical protein
MKQEEVAAVCWAALEGVAKKQCRRDALVAGAEYDVMLRVSGELKTKAFAAEVEAHVAVNHDGVRIVSNAPPMPQLIGYLLAQLSAAKRRLLLDTLPEEFARAGNLLPDVDAALVEAAEQLLSRLRAKVQQNYRGGVSTSYRLHAMGEG